MNSQVKCFDFSSLVIREKNIGQASVFYTERIPYLLFVKTPRLSYSSEFSNLDDLHYALNELELKSHVTDDLPQVGSIYFLKLQTDIAYCQVVKVDQKPYVRLIQRLREFDGQSFVCSPLMGNYLNSHELEAQILDCGQELMVNGATFHRLSPLYPFDMELSILGIYGSQRVVLD